MLNFRGVILLNSCAGLFALEQNQLPPCLSQQVSLKKILDFSVVKIFPNEKKGAPRRWKQNRGGHGDFCPVGEKRSFVKMEDELRVSF